MLRCPRFCSAVSEYSGNQPERSPMSLGSKRDLNPGPRALHLWRHVASTWSCPSVLYAQSSRYRVCGCQPVANMFRATSRLLACRITFFTRTPCGLCDTAKAVVQNVRAKRPFEYEEINVMDSGHEKWKSLYEFDTPVVRRPGHQRDNIAMRRVPECSTRSTSTRPKPRRRAHLH